MDPVVFRQPVLFLLLLRRLTHELVLLDRLQQLPDLEDRHQDHLIVVERPVYQHRYHESVHIGF